MNTEKESNAGKAEETCSQREANQSTQHSTQEKEVIPPKKTRPVIFYIVLMFGVALFLIVLSFFMQQRNHEAIMKGLSTSAIHVQNIVDLEESLTALQSNLETVMTEKESLEAELASARNGLLAMEYLYEAQIDHLSGRNKQAKSHLAALQKDNLYTFLPQTSTLEGQPSPLQHYHALVNALR